MKKTLLFFAAVMALSACDFLDTPPLVFDSGPATVYIFDDPSGEYVFSNHIQLLSSYNWSMENSAPQYINLSAGNNGSAGVHHLSLSLTSALKERLKDPDTHFTMVAGEGYLIATLRFSAPSYTGGSHSVTVYYQPNVVLSYDLNGGSGTAPATVTLAWGKTQTVTLPDGTGLTPPPNHLSFLGWSKTPGGLPLSGPSYDLTATVTLYAIWDGDGSTAAAPKLVFTKEELASINDNATSRGLHYKLMKNINLESIAWTPIGLKDDNSFTGSFDGNKKTISNLTISGSIKYAGLFGCIRSGTGIIVVQNLNLEDVNVDVDVEDNVGAGAVVGWLCYGIIQGCSVTGTVSGGPYAGGITGTSDFDTSIQNCYVTAGISATSATDARAGGITGQSNGPIQYCYATGAVSATGSGDKYAGGIAGFKEMGAIQSCVALNSSVSDAGLTHRIVGEYYYPGAPPVNNYGWVNMKKGSSSFSWTSDLDGEDGANCATIPVESFWTDLGWDSTIWNFVAGSLPTLK